MRTTVESHNIIVITCKISILFLYNLKFVVAKRIPQLKQSFLNK